MKGQNGGNSNAIILTAVGAGGSRTHCSLAFQILLSPIEAGMQNDLNPNKGCDGMERQCMVKETEASISQQEFRGGGMCKKF